MEEERRHASPEGLRSEKDAVLIVKHDENEQSATKTTKKWRNMFSPDFRCSFPLCFHSQYVRDMALYEVFLQSELSRDVFSYFLIPFSAKTPSFESISGRPSSKKALKNKCVRLEGYKK